MPAFVLAAFGQTLVLADFGCLLAAFGQPVVLDDFDFGCLLAGFGQPVVLADFGCLFFAVSAFSAVSGFAAASRPRPFVFYFCRLAFSLLLFLAGVLVPRHQQ